MEKEKKIILYGKPSYQSEEEVYGVPKKVCEKYEFKLGDCCLTTNGKKANLMIITKIVWLDKEEKVVDENGNRIRIQKVLKKVESIPKYLQNLHNEILEAIAE